MDRRYNILMYYRREIDNRDLEMDESERAKEGRDKERKEGRRMGGRKARKMLIIDSRLRSLVPPASKYRSRRGFLLSGFFFQKENRKCLLSDFFPASPSLGHTSGALSGGTAQLPALQAKRNLRTLLNMWPTASPSKRLTSREDLRRPHRHLLPGQSAKMSWKEPACLQGF